ncbi:MAG: hypothetical protein AMXMBFR53_27550 [Gemmatimonadota bacterium]
MAREEQAGRRHPEQRQGYGQDEDHLEQGEAAPGLDAPVAWGTAGQRVFSWKDGLTVFVNRTTLQ